MLHVLVRPRRALACGVACTAAALALVPYGYALLAVAALALYIALFGSIIVVGDPQPARRHVFCIGLSRTGTTSVSCALAQLGYSVFHEV